MKVRSISNQDFENKTYDNYFKSKISVIEKPSRFIVIHKHSFRSTNVKIRAKHLAKIFRLLVLLNFSSSLTTEYINLNASEILAFIEGKSTKLSKNFNCV
jgi:hypothetical protein